jgi:hypothetical protein
LTRSRQPDLSKQLYAAGPRHDRRGAGVSVAEDPQPGMGRVYLGVPRRPAGRGQGDPGGAGCRSRVPDALRREELRGQPLLLRLRESVEVNALIMQTMSRDWSAEDSRKRPGRPCYRLQASSVASGEHQGSPVTASVKQSPPKAHPAICPAEPYGAPTLLESGSRLGRPQIDLPTGRSERRLIDDLAPARASGVMSTAQVRRERSAAPRPSCWLWRTRNVEAAQPTPVAQHQFCPEESPD